MLDVEWKFRFLSVTVILLDDSSGGVRCRWGSRSTAQCFISPERLNGFCRALKGQANHLLVSFFNKLYVNQPSRYYLVLSERNSGGKWGWNLQNFTWGENRDSKANVRTDKSFISACLSNESFLSYQVGWPSLQLPPTPHPSKYPPFSSLWWPTSPPPFTSSAGFPPQSLPLTQIRSGAERRVKACTHSADQTKAWHRYKQGGSQQWKRVWLGWRWKRPHWRHWSRRVPWAGL